MRISGLLPARTHMPMPGGPTGIYKAEVFPKFVKLSTELSPH